MGRLTAKQDAYGQAVYDYFHGKGGFEIVERDDGGIAISPGPRAYLAPFKDWSPQQRKAVRLARGKVLDVGCGAGRVALYLQEKGLDVTGIDISPLALKVCRERGLKKVRLLSITQLTAKLGVFDTIVMYGNNFGLFGGFKRAKWLLRRFHAMTSYRARIVAQSRDPYATTLPHHLAYHRRNRRRGRMAGQVRIRTRYLNYATPYFDYLLVSREEMHQIVADTGWKISRFFDPTGPGYVAVIEKE